MNLMVLFESEMCCGTKMTGAEVNKKLLYLSPTLQKIQRQTDFEVERHSLTIEPEVFIANEEVKLLMEKSGISVLPVTIVNGEVKKFGVYPSLEEFANYTGLTI
ncbi:arsenic metallochaperone ArsD family protein [Listeria monocytogenes]|uniref:arsenite efflux transporter metallochaperone ArsD-related protein n=1 Tax=Enterococcus casseliflavus TaxID=37734 RepID=UPI000F4F8E80|nr:arsenite efflux transporter metallochaperone ArsD-related protein [Enterococcus casseliflavus]EDO1241678.1 arsenic metallochaperone ArsD family protein [Listeria monocytogenes]EHH9516704.1 arsenic metallochaperone ArsD family protein [Listeria monocytogenes]EIG8026203.1 arsenic metallochaperone ArsD family protein [Listeria monocytogenes]ROY39691.1 arsenical resistance operon transcriptional repressor ArsD [Enterococcus casseliflavus]